MTTREEIEKEATAIILEGVDPYYHEVTLSGCGVYKQELIRMALFGARLGFQAGKEAVLLHPKETRPTAEDFLKTIEEKKG